MQQSEDLMRLFRRILQLAYLIADDSLSDGGAIRKRMTDRYDLSAEVDHYREIAFQGFYDEEEAVVHESLRSSASNQKSALVVGCGAGRECFALREKGFSVIGLDISPRMIAAARQLALEKKIDISFQAGAVEDFVSTRKFDLVFVSAAIVEHVRTRRARVEYYRKIHSLLAVGGKASFIPEVRSLRPFGRDAVFYWASMILKWRWRGKGIWEPGDSVRSFFGKHNKDHRLVYYHFYRDIDEFLSEVHEAGLEKEFESGGAYLFQASQLESQRGMKS